MKLRTLSVNQFKRFTEPTLLGDLQDGLNLVVGPNEFGKSTLLDALRAVLFERYSSRARPIVALQNDRSGAAPVVELDFEVSGAKYKLTKRFVKSTYAQLRCPDGTLLEADAAEDKLRELLGFAEAGIRGANSETLGMWGVLWVQQGQSFGGPELPDSALASLSAGLESEVGVVLGGRKAKELPQIIENSLREFVTKARRQPRGPYKSSIDRVTEKDELLGEQLQQQLAMSETLEKLATAESRLKRLDAGNQDRIDQEELTRARDQLAEAMQRESKIEAAHSQLQNLEGQLAEAQRAQSDRASRRSELTEAQDRLRKQRGRLKEFKIKARESSAPLVNLRRRLEKARANLEATEQAEVKCRFILNLITRKEELGELERRQKDVADAQQRFNDARRKAQQIQVTDESLRRLRQAANSVNEATAQLSVNATRISFEIPGDRLNGIEVDGAALANPPNPFDAVRRVEISIPERGRILVDPNRTDRDQLMHAERVAQTALRVALEQAGARSLAQAEIQRDQRRDFESTAAAASQELQRLAPAGGALALQNQIDELRQWQQSLSPKWRTAKLPERRSAGAALHDVQAELQKVREHERVARAAVEERGLAIADINAEVLKAQSAVELQTEMVQRRQQNLLSDVRSAPDSRLAEVTDAAAEAVTNQRRSVSELESKWSAGTRPQLEARIARLEKTIKQRASLRTALRTEIARLYERIEFHDSVGIDEAIELTRSELELAQRARDRMKREIAVLDLLSKTLRAAESEAKERYLEPVLSRVRPYLQMLFPNAEIGMDEDLKITGMSRGAGYEERFDHLSMGTQEQVAVLVRLAFAEMLIDRGAPAAVILDDALVFSDDHRMQLMFDILSHASKHVQIVVFTCREQLFEGLGAHHLHLSPGDHERLRSA